MDVSNVPSMLRSVLLSSKHPIPIKKLLQEFQLLIGWPIPFKELGFKSLQEYLQSIPDVVKLSRNNNGEIFCEAVSTSPTVHISNLVRQQKNDKKPPFRGPVPRHPSKRRPTPPHLPLSRRSPPLPAVKPMKTTAAVAHQKPMPPPALLPTPVSKTNNTLLPTPVSKTNYEVPPRFAKHASRSVQLSSHGLSVTINFGQTPPSSPTCPSSSARHNNAVHREKVTNDTNQRKATNTASQGNQAKYDAQDGSGRICEPKQFRKTFVQNAVHREAGKASVFQYSKCEPSEVYIVSDRKIEQRGRRARGSKMCPGGLKS